MNIELNDDSIVKAFLNSDDTMTSIGISFGRKSVQKKYPELCEYITARYDDSECLKETIIRMKYHIEQRPICKTCHGRVHFNIQKLSNGTFFPTYCGTSCQMKDPEQKKLHDRLVLEHTGSVNNINKQRQTKKERYGDEHYSNQKKREETNLQRYGNICPLVNKEVRKKTEETNLIRYGNKCAQKSDEVKHKIGKANKMAAKHKTPFERHMISVRAAKTRGEDSRNTNGTSLPERNGLSYLRMIFGPSNVKTQHYDEYLYPFPCDYYIVSLDTWIELQENQFYHWIKPYDANDIECRERIKYLLKNMINADTETKRLRYYDAINTYKEGDTKKRKYALKSGIRWYEFWKVDEMIKWVNELRNIVLNIDGLSIDREGIW